MSLPLSFSIYAPKETKLIVLEVPSADESVEFRVGRERCIDEQSVYVSQHALPSRLKHSYTSTLLV